MLDAKGLKDIAILADRLTGCGATVDRCLPGIVQRDQTRVGVKRHPEKKNHNATATTRGIIKTHSTDF